MVERSSRISGFYKLTREERIEHVRRFASLTDDETRGLSGGALSLDVAERMVENVIGLMEVPLGIAVNFLINGQDYLIPMAIEEPSVIAAASNAAKMARAGGGFYTSSTPPVMIGQVQLLGVPDPFGAKMEVIRRKEEVLEIANSKDPVLVKHGGGAKDIEVRVLDTPRGAMVVVHLLVDCRDAMGANAVNTMAEAVAPTLAHITGGRPLLRIISNLADRRLARARAVFPKDAIGGDEVVEGILDAHALAKADPYRAATHNKGIMNGITAMALATGNDTRAIEAGAHAYAARYGRYEPLSTWEKNANGDLVGTIELPMAVGLVGGATRTHPTAQTNVKILGVKSASELAEVMAAVGLAQNFAALRALVTEGIQRGHMSLHSRNVAIAAGAEGKLVDIVAERMVQEGVIRVDRARQLIEELKNE
ncbi:hydroxymethylglutaryl-CoA reductase, degradative [Methermicoccus shengliensis]|uniref:3-hydroxy-3-methylglutaryl coenzyme A reductase n=1 Tax=Methermicoccus shengliensis TaxID=660064 RepID=A0A832W0I7_9EURY|nr:hydroxymethylglutaryl-CoA reductase, degradative [Methermicoccus shengliensis]KUK04531.1 MAG: Hydroxymethylglutaryl-CoA reductase, degradative [Euryarchaeota archaeon 55_53]KUK30615.1 MAG: Hydroxymethylglutaryl-CoA reductase, degradative [Methanosarcinales archeaon 56_1174]MDI3488164.1 hydroxymethylglutaryl-CoA reductase [Methanosarcinales archaeon]MDN5295439.1 hydroxymethylglutaryl-CoA reductase [Methanosarcinales archaeon]HIH70205.1 hydroxymethylglutaryl-CoA reductase, degradative [Mether